MQWAQLSDSVNGEIALLKSKPLDFHDGVKGKERETPSLEHLSARLSLGKVFWIFRSVFNGLGISIRTPQHRNFYARYRRRCLKHALQTCLKDTKENKHNSCAFLGRSAYFYVAFAVGSVCACTFMHVCVNQTKNLNHCPSPCCS